MLLETVPAVNFHSWFAIVLAVLGMAVGRRFHDPADC